MGKDSGLSRTDGDLGSTLWAKLVPPSNLQLEKPTLHGYRKGFLAPTLLIFTVVVDSYPRPSFGKLES